MKDNKLKSNCIPSIVKLKSFLKKLFKNMKIYFDLNNFIFI